jgi:hypothetical protein
MTERICPNCGVELDRGIETCPLCGGINESVEPSRKKDEAFYPSEILKLNSRQRARIAWELSGIIAASGMLVSLIVDLVIKKGLDWSLYSVTIIAGIWIFITLFIFARNRLWILLPGLTMATLGIQALIDLFSPPIVWFIHLSLPFTVSLFILVAIVIFLTKKALYKGFNILALAFLALSAQLIVIETFTDLFLNRKVEIEWSAITASAIVPFSSILIFIHYRLKRGLNLKSYFHV